MPALTNVRHERFARAVIRTGVAARAYLKAGYTPTTRNALDVSACQLLRRPKVQARIRELRKQMAARNRISVDTLLDDLAADRALARTLGQPSAAIAATQLTAKLVGLLIDRTKTGQAGEFAVLQTEEEVLATVRAELGPASALVLAAELAKPRRGAERSRGQPRSHARGR
jgi:hypothetical protein